MTYWTVINWDGGELEVHGDYGFVWSYHAPTSSQIEAFNKMAFIFNAFNTTTDNARRALDALVNRKAMGHGG